MKTEDFKPGDLILVHTKTKSGTDIRSAKVCCVNYNGNRLVTFEGYGDKNYRPSGQGAFNPERVGTRPFGIVRVERVGYEAYKAVNFNGGYPRAGDPGYDLMC